MHFNYFTVKQAMDLGKGYVLLICCHEYGNAPDMRLPVLGAVSDFPAGCRIEVEAKKV